MTLDEAPALSSDHSFHQHQFAAQIEDELNGTLQQQSASVVNESSASSSSNVSIADTDVTSSHEDEEHVSVGPIEPRIEPRIEPEVKQEEVQVSERPESPDKQQLSADGWMQDVLYLISMDGESLFFDALYAA